MTEQKFIDKYCCTDSHAEYCNDDCDSCEREFKKDLELIKERIRAEVIEEVNIILKNMYLEISNTVNGNDYTSKNDLVTVVASKCRRYVSEKLKEQEHG